MELTDSVWLCFSGGNAIGAYHAGAYEALAEAGIEPTAIAGASIGAVVAALIVGNPPEDRVTKLKKFWALAEQSSFFPDTKGTRIASGIQTLLGGRPGLFHPRFDWSFLGMSSRSSVFDPAPMRRELERLIDFDRLNFGEIRLAVTAVDIETGELVSFDTRDVPLTVDHLMASTAFPVFFPPVLLDGKYYVDPGVVCNLPIEALFSEIPEKSVTCFALDAAVPDGRVPNGLDDALIRAQDILFSAQSKFALQRVKRRLEEQRPSTSGPRAWSSVHYRTFRDEAAQESGLKMIDFRRESLAQRWVEGRKAMNDVLVTAAKGPASLQRWRSGEGTAAAGDAEAAPTSTFQID